MKRRFLPEDQKKAELKNGNQAVRRLPGNVSTHIKQVADSSSSSSSSSSISSSSRSTSSTSHQYELEEGEISPSSSSSSSSSTSSSSRSTSSTSHQSELEEGEIPPRTTSQAEYEKYIKTYAYPADHSYFLTLNRGQNSQQKEIDDFVKELKVDPSRNVLIPYGFILPNDYQAVYKIAYAYISLICETNGFVKVKGNTRPLNVGCAVFTDKKNNTKSLILVLSGKKTTEYFNDNGLTVIQYISQLYNNTGNNLHMKQIKEFMGQGKQFDDIKHYCDVVSDAFVDMQKNITDPRSKENKKRGFVNPYFYACSEPILADECEKFLNADPENHIVNGTVEFHFDVRFENRQQKVATFYPQESCPTNCQVHYKAGYYDQLRSTLHQSLEKTHPIGSSITDMVHTEEDSLKELQDKKAEMVGKRAELQSQLDLTKANINETLVELEKARLQKSQLPSVSKLTANQESLEEEKQLAEQILQDISELELFEQDLIQIIETSKKKISVMESELLDLGKAFQEALRFDQIKQINQMTDVLKEEIAEERESKDFVETILNKNKSIEVQGKPRTLEEIKKLVLVYQAGIKLDSEVNSDQTVKSLQAFTMFNQNQTKMELLEAEEDKLSADVKRSQTEIDKFQEFKIGSMQDRITLHKQAENINSNKNRNKNSHHNHNHNHNHYHNRNNSGQKFKHKH